MSEPIDFYGVAWPQECADPIVETVRQKLKARSEVGIAKYGHTLARTDLSRLDWLRHAQEEAMDLALYLQKLIDLEMSPPDWSAA
ncbi:hypothetical protein [Candidatus Contendibacter odensensis]|uniref:Uncharacterized protein n=1 Tax=Candidatus Contendobacter odensis Run_B_J11 TaxID=1400861 RepID=A0A7U7GFJ7_9GAMM|nr:hypothetical protein [Candidatus Contendobacter odensis]CDH46966.1 hypothetical protein BN874_690016 [Candidatus Contendobacter odensis Run_B_J11]